MALTEDGALYSWGLGLNGHLGQGDENSNIIPELVSFYFTDEEKNLKKIKKKHRDIKAL
jgi:hypothetical protein